MQYTVWSHGQLVGTTDLGFIDREGTHRTGHFFPSEYGETLIPIINEPRRVFKAITQIPRSNKRGSLRNDPEWIALDSAHNAACDRERSLAFELRDERGVVIPTEYVSIRDMELTLELYPGDEHDDDEVPMTPELQADIDHDLALIEEWDDERRRERNLLGEPDEDEDGQLPFPRFQVQVSLLHEWSIP